MANQINAERAWLISIKIFEEIKSTEFKDFYKLESDKITYIFIRNKLHRFNEKMVKIFYLAVPDFVS